MDRKKLVKELEDIRWELAGEDGCIAEAMENIVEVLQDYQAETKDESWRSIVKDYYTSLQVKQSIVDLLNSSMNFSADLLRKAVNSLSECKIQDIWYKKVKEKFYDVTEKDVNELIDQLCKKYQSKAELNKYKKKAIENINAVDVNADDVEDTYNKLENISINYFADTNDRELLDFCNRWFLSLDDLKKSLKVEIDESIDGTLDLKELKRKIRDCKFDSETYQVFEDGSYMDLTDEGLGWLKATLLKILREKK